MKEAHRVQREQRARLDHNAAHEPECAEADERSVERGIALDEHRIDLPREGVVDDRARGGLHVDASAGSRQDVQAPDEVHRRAEVVRGAMGAGRQRAGERLAVVGARGGQRESLDGEVAVQVLDGLAGLDEAQRNAAQARRVGERVGRRRRAKPLQALGVDQPVPAEPHLARGPLAALDAQLTAISRGVTDDAAKLGARRTVEPKLLREARARRIAAGEVHAFRLVVIGAMPPDRAERRVIDAQPFEAGHSSAPRSGGTNPTLHRYSTRTGCHIPSVSTLTRSKPRWSRTVTS